MYMLARQATATLGYREARKEGQGWETLKLDVFGQYG